MPRLTKQPDLVVGVSLTLAISELPNQSIHGSILSWNRRTRRIVVRGRVVRQNSDSSVEDWVEMLVNHRQTLVGQPTKFVLAIAASSIEDVGWCLLARTAVPAMYAIHRCGPNAY